MSKLYKGYEAGKQIFKGFQKLFNPSAKKKTDIPTTIIGVKPGKNLTTKRNIQDKTVKAVDEGIKKADVPQSMKESQKTKQYASEMKRKKSKELKDLSYRLDKLTEKKAKGGRVGLKLGTNKKSNVAKIKKTFGPKKGLGMQSVIYGLDKNPKITAADPKAKFIAAANKKKKKKVI